MGPELNNLNQTPINKEKSLGWVDDKDLRHKFSQISWIPLEELLAYDPWFDLTWTMPEKLQKKVRENSVSRCGLWHRLDNWVCQICRISRSSHGN